VRFLHPPRRPASPENSCGHDLARWVRPTAPVLKVQVAVHLAHRGVAAGRATTALRVHTAMLESALRWAGSTTLCAPVPPCGGPGSGWFGRFCN
jgi:hypothetical protein